MMIASPENPMVVLPALHNAFGTGHAMRLMTKLTISNVQTLLPNRVTKDRRLLALTIYMDSECNRMYKSGEFEDIPFVRTLALANESLLALYNAFLDKARTEGRMAEVDRGVQRMHVVLDSRDADHAVLDMKYKAPPYGQLMSPLPKKEWFARHLSGAKRLPSVLDMSQIDDVQWLVKHVHPEDLSWALTKTPPAILNSVDLDWLVAHVDKKWMCRVLKARGTLVPGGVSREWIVRHVARTDAAEALRKTNNLTADLGWRYLSKHIANDQVVDVMRELNLMTPEPGADWYRTRVPKSALLKTLKELGLLDGSLSRAWITKHVAVSDRAEALRLASHVVTRASISNLRLMDRFRNAHRAGLMRYDDFPSAADARAWFYDVMPNSCLLHALTLSGLVTADAGKQWYFDHLNDHDATTALIIAGLYEDGDE